MPLDKPGKVTDGCPRCGRNRRNCKGHDTKKEEDTDGRDR